MRFMVEEILNNLPLQGSTDSETPATAENIAGDDDNFVRCEDLTEFVRSLKNLVSESELEKQTLYIVRKGLNMYCGEFIFM